MLRTTELYGVLFYKEFRLEISVPMSGYVQQLEFIIEPARGPARHYPWGAVRW